MCPSDMNSLYRSDILLIPSFTLFFKTHYSFGATGHISHIKAKGIFEETFL